MEHQAIPPGQIHVPYQWITASDTARLAIVPSVGDLYKRCLQLDTGAEYRLTAVSPAAWFLTGYTTAAIDTSLALKADAAAVTTALGLKADASAVATSLAGKEPAVDAGTAGTFYANDKTWKNPLLDAVALSAGSMASAPATDKYSIFGRIFSKRVMPSAIGPAGMDYTFQPALWRQKISRSSPIGGATTMPVPDGMAPWTTAGTITSRSFAATNRLTRMRRIGLVSSTTAGTFATVRTGVGQFAIGNGTDGGFFKSWRFAFSDAAAVSGARAFFGMIASVSTPSNVEPNTLVNCVGVAQLSTDSTQLYIVFGGTAAQTAVALGTGFPPYVGTPGPTTGVPYELMLFAPPNSPKIHWQLERLDTGATTSGTIGDGSGNTAVVPDPATVSLNPVGWRCNNATAAAVAFDFISHYIETDY